MARLLEELKSWWASRQPRDPSKCLLLEWDDITVRVKVLEAFDEGWNQEFPWSGITRVCFSDGGISMSDVLSLEIQGREKPAVVLTEAQGGPEFMAELLKRELFPQKVFNKAITSTDGSTHCWPPDKE